MRTKSISIWLMILFTIFTAFAQLLLKIGSKDNLINLYVLSGVVSYSIGTLFYIFALKHGELSTLFPLISLGFIWITIISIIYLKESYTITKFVGILFVIIGVSFLGVKR